MADPIRITLPEPVLSDADIDAKSIRIIARQRGIADRAKDFVATNPTGDRAVFLAAEQKVHQAAGEPELLARGRTNTEHWLDTFSARRASKP